VSTFNTHNKFGIPEGHHEISHTSKGYIYIYIYIYTQGVTGGKGQTSGGCSLC